MRVEKVLIWQNIIVIAAAVALIFFSFLLGNYEPTSFEGTFDYEKLQYSELIYADGTVSTDVKYPINVKAVKGDLITLIAELPDEIPDGYGIMVPTNYSGIRVYAGEELVGSYCESQPLPIGHLVGNVRLITEIDKHYAGQELRIEIRPFYTNSFGYDEFLLGNVNALKLHVIYKNLWRLVLASILLTVAVICFGISFSHFAKKLPTNNWAFYHMGCFLFYIMTWLICSSDIPQLFTDANETVSLMSFISLAVMCIHYAAFSTEVISDSRKVFSAVQVVGWIFTAAEIFGFVTGLFEPPDILLANHFYIGLTCVSVIVMCIRRWKTDENARSYIFANVVLVLGAVMALLMFYCFQNTGYDAVLLGMFITVYVFFLFHIIMRMDWKYMRELQTNDIYKELAYRDIMTGLGNRRAFNEMLTAIESDTDRYGEVGLAILDINRLKEVNDCSGHEIGDAMITKAAECISNAYKDVASCYRIGGDEFAIVFTDNISEESRCRRALYESIDRVNEDSEKFTLSIALGFAKAVNSGVNFTTGLFRAADNGMYEDKERWHKLLDEEK